MRAQSKPFRCGFGAPLAAAAHSDWLSLSEGLTRAYDHSTWECGPEGNPYAATGYRLPTDAEWEYAAQWNDERIYPWGYEIPTCSLANLYYDNDYCVHWTSPVGSYPDGVQPNLANPIYDLSGNVLEWVNDLMQCNLGTFPETDPVGPAGGFYMVTRGGDWYNYGVYLRAASRIQFSPGDSNYGIGFRPVRSD